MAPKARLVTLIPIRKMNRAIKFYTDVLGCRKGDRGRGEMRDMWASVSFAGHDIWLIVPSARERRRLAYSTFLVPDIKRFVGRLTKKGVKFDRAERMGPESRIEGPIAFESWGASAFFKDPEGNTLMVWQNFPAM